jgi:hypothetical protein
MVLAVNCAPQEPAEGQADLFDLEQFVVGHVTDRMLADGLEHVLDR